MATTATVAPTAGEREIPLAAHECLAHAARRIAHAWEAIKDAENEIRLADELGRIRDPRVRVVLAAVEHTSRELATLRREAS